MVQKVLPIERHMTPVIFPQKKPPMIRPSGYGRSARVVDFTEYLSPTSNVAKVPSATKTLQKIQATTVSSGNTLDKSAPGALHKGKTRTEPRKPTKTKKIIIEERTKNQTTACSSDVVDDLSPTHSNSTLDDDDDEDGNAVGVESIGGHESVVDPRLSINKQSSELDAAVVTFLSEIKRFQDRVWAKNPVKGRIKRRLVCGLREAKKQLELQNVKCMIFAINIESITMPGGLNEQIIDLSEECRRQQIPVIFALSRNKLGRTVKKQCVSCIAVVDFDGAQVLYKNMLDQLANVG